MGIQRLYHHYIRSKGVSIDTRTIKEGQIFFALQGTHANGNLYAEKALTAGALKVIIDDHSIAHKDDRYVLVDDSLVALQMLATHHRSQLKIPVIGITGSNGKTTTKELLYKVLSKVHKVGATQGNYNNHIGVPLTILNVDRTAELMIVEMGTNQPGDIAQLCDIAQPTHGMITNIGASHLEKLISKEGVYAEKKALFDYVSLHGGVFFVNTSDDLLVQLSSATDLSIDYTNRAGAYGQIGIVQSTDQQLCIELIQNKQSFEVKTNLHGAYNIENISACLTISDHFNIPLEYSLEAIESYCPSNMRSQLVHTKKNIVILDAYNANPSSMSASIKSCSEDKENVLMILGDMLELGAKAESFHQDIIELLEALKVNAILVGAVFSQVANERYRSYNDVDLLIQSGVLDDITDQNILVKASRGIKLEKIVPYL